jgi:hypothetical protein
MGNPFESKNQAIGGAFTAENCWLDLGGNNVDAQGAIIQRANFSIERPINFIYEIGSKEGPANVYYIGGRRRGQATFERVVGGANLFRAFLTQYGTLCPAANAAPPKDITLTAKGGCNIKPAAGAAVGVKYTLVTPRLTTVGASVSAQEIVIMENLSMAFLELDVDDA